METTASAPSTKLKKKVETAWRDVTVWHNKILIKVPISLLKNPACILQLHPNGILWLSGSKGPSADYTQNTQDGSSGHHKMPAPCNQPPQALFPLQMHLLWPAAVAPHLDPVSPPRHSPCQWHFVVDKTHQVSPIMFWGQIVNANNRKSGHISQQAEPLIQAQQSLQRCPPWWLRW